MRPERSVKNEKGRGLCARGLAKIFRVSEEGRIYVTSPPWSAAAAPTPRSVHMERTKQTAVWCWVAGFIEKNLV
jgi:hypothetical protein